MAKSPEIVTNRPNRQRPLCQPGLDGRRRIHTRGGDVASCLPTKDRTAVSLREDVPWKLDTDADRIISIPLTHAMAERYRFIPDLLIQMERRSR